jgi:hypothetical protein
MRDEYDFSGGVRGKYAGRISGIIHRQRSPDGGAEDPPAEHPDQNPEDGVRTGAAIPQRLIGLVAEPEAEQNCDNVNDPEQYPKRHNAS